MKAFNKILVAALAFLFLPSLGMAYAIDDRKYFAYVEGAGTRTQYLMLLSRQACKAKGAPKSAKLASYVYFHSFGQTSEVPACWYLHKMTDGRGQRVIAVCTTLQNVMDGGDAACNFASRSRFIDTSTLPREAQF